MTSVESSSLSSHRPSSHSPSSRSGSEYSGSEYSGSEYSGSECGGSAYLGSTYGLGTRGIGILAILMLWAAAVHISSPLSALLSQSLDLGLTEFQILALPLIVLLLIRLRFGSHQASRAALALGVCGAAISVWFSYAPVTSASHVLLVAPLKNDELETESTKIREAINEAIGRHEYYGDVRAIRHHLAVKGQREAAKILSKSAQGEVLVWGDARLIRISFPSSEDMLDYKDNSIAEPWGTALNLHMIFSVPIIALSFEPPADTAQFIAKLFSALSFIDKGPAGYEAALMGLAEAGSIAASWRSFAHRAYPWWMRGNLILQSALEKPRGAATHHSIELGDIECAIESYDHARSFLRYGDNPELLAAILNNRAIALYLKAVLLGKPLYRALAKKNFNAAASALKHTNLFGIKYRAGKVARANSKQLTQNTVDRGYFRTKKLRDRDGEMKRNIKKQLKAKEKKVKGKARVINHD